MGANSHRKSSKKNPSDAPTDAGGAADQPRKPEPAVPEVPVAPAAEDAPSADSAGATSGIPVIGLGGSAGALESFKVFFEAMPPASGAAFIVIQHLAPAHESLLPEILTQHTRMKVVQAQTDAPVEPNCVYVIPPGQYLGIRDGVLYLAEPVKQDGLRMPIDFFFRTLAEDRQERGVCILFSGAGSDGTLGMRALRGAGGLTLAQDPRTAQYDPMPRSAISANLVDYILPPSAMPQAIMEFLRQPYVQGGEPAAVVEAEGRPGGFNDVLALVLARTGCDFRCYKKSTILRRIERRMGLRHIADMGRYSDLLRQDAGEVGQLQKDLLINVTTFFRDAEAFDDLRRLALAPLLEAKPIDEPLRIWVPGCSTGEEAYSLVMLLVEEMTEARKNASLQVFATDLDQEALEVGRRGLYPESIVADVSAERLARFFVRKEHGYQVSEAVRNTVVFAAQNLISDPPFSKIDLISCRNLLIYLDTTIQARLMPLFNFALNTGGYLFLGKSEGIGGQGDLFSPVSKKAKLFRRTPPARPILLDSPILPGRNRSLAALVPTTGRPPAAAYADVIRQALLNHFAAGVVLVDPHGQILQLLGNTGKYLNMPQGEPNLNLLDAAKEGLSMRLRSALHTAHDEARTVVLDPVPVTREEGTPLARVTVAPVARRGSAGPAPGSAAGLPHAEPADRSVEAAPLLAVIFEDVARRSTAAKAEEAPCATNEAAVRQLEDELRATQQDLQASIGDLQASNEELRIANEEVVSTNEELQSTNEELETSKEELQSINEELITVNNQLQEKVERLDAAHADLANLLTSTEIATLFLDHDLHVKFFTPAATRVVKLIPSDTGRPISDLSMNFIDYDLAADARAVARNATVLERDVRHGDGSFYVVRIMPYRAASGRAEGVVVTFADVTRLRQGERQMRRLATVLTDSNDAVILADLSGAIRAWNRGAQRMYGWTEEEALRMNLADIAPADAPAEASDLLRRLKAGESGMSCEAKRRAKNGRPVDVWLTATAVRDESNNVEMIATTERDLSERRNREERIRSLKALSRSSQVMTRVTDEAAFLQEVCKIVVEGCGHAMVWIGYAENDDAKTVRPVASAGFEAGYLDTLKVTWADTERGRGPTGTAIRTGQVSACRHMLTDPLFAPWREEALQRGYASSIVMPLAAGGRVFGALTIYSKEPDPFTDEEVRLLSELADDLAHGVTSLRLQAERKRAEAALQNTLQRFYAILSCMYSGVLLVTDEGRVEFVNQSFCDQFGLTEAPADLVGLESSAMAQKIKTAYLHPDEAVVRIREIVDQGQPVRDEELAMHDGRTCLRDYIPLNLDGRAYGRLWIHLDITPRKQAEETLKRIADELERSNRDLEQFAYVASHDLQTPLREVKGFLNLLRERYRGKLDEKADEFIDFAVSGAARMSELITDLLAYSQVGNKDMKLQPVDLREPLDRAVTMIGNAIAESGARITVADLPKVRTDSVQIAQVFLNLIGNAVKFRSERPVEIDIGARREGGQWILWVKDNGIGLDPAHSERAFELFTRLHQRSKYPGTGIGLAICKKIIERHGGRIWVESRIGEGATFYFTLPA